MPIYTWNLGEVPGIEMNTHGSLYDGNGKEITGYIFAFDTDTGKTWEYLYRQDEKGQSNPVYTADGGSIVQIVKEYPPPLKFVPFSIPSGEDEADTPIIVG